MSDYKFHIEPRDLLFLRDARPMEASDAGLGATWPRPDQIWNAFINAFHARWPEPQEWEGHRHICKDNDKNKDSSFRFGALKSAGPFPTDEAAKEIYFPCPLDLSADAEGNLFPMELTSSAGTNMPKPLSLAFRPSKIGKEEPPQWISASDYGKYLRGESFKPAKPELYFAERNIGIAIDPATQSAAKGRLYQAEYLRFHPGVSMAVQVSCVLANGADVFAKVAEEENIPLILGGQQGVAAATRRKGDFSLPLPLSAAPAGSPILLRWTLLSPAVFPETAANSAEGIGQHPGGWLPSWIDAVSGQVMLPRGKVQRLENEPRDAWRKRIKDAGKFTARLVAARIARPLVFSGWDLKTGPKPTYLAVPPGSAYVFDVRDPGEAKDLSDALSWNGGEGGHVKNRRSTLFGEKGFGLGVCSVIKKANQE